MFLVLSSKAKRNIFSGTISLFFSFQKCFVIRLELFSSLGLCFVQLRFEFEIVWRPVEKFGLAADRTGMGFLRIGLEQMAPVLD